MTLNSPLAELKGVGPELNQKFAVLGLKTVQQLIDYYPRRYEDYSEVTETNSLRPGAMTIEALIKQVKGRYVRRGLHITEAVASDSKGSVRLVWFNQPYRETSVKNDQPYFISGTYELKRQRFAIMNPSIELVSNFPLNTARLVPIYRETKGLNSRQIRLALAQVLPQIEALAETLPAAVIKKTGLLSRAEATKLIHFPDSQDDLEAAKRRLGFEEVLSFALASLMNKLENQSEHALKVPFNEKLAQDFVKNLPFKLTDAQRRVIWQIYLDLQQPHPMNRLVEGDVGAGKTVVATMAALMALEQGWQVALMAPTELLARQHTETIFNLLKPLGKESLVALLVGSQGAQEKNLSRQAIAANQARFIVGTQALLAEKVDFHKLALVMVDEQHRFGVSDRAKLQSKAGHMPHLLSLTATPIPRSLALTLFGEVDISTLDTKPPGRLPVETDIISPNSVNQLYTKIDKELASGRQLFVVCPLIFESESSDLRSAELVYDQLSKGVFKHRRVGLLHGRLKNATKTKVMQDFVDHKLDILVATTVIEVGVDVPNATMMLVEGAERFGLAQLHQLRGRVGRGQHQGYCYLMLDSSAEPSRRLRALQSSVDGFRLAELDLELRGPGAIYGNNQHGQLDLRIAKLSDAKLIAEARKSAAAMMASRENLLKYKELMNNVNRLRAVTNLN